MSQQAYSYLVKILSGRDFSEHKLREKLRAKKYPANEIDAAINEIKARGYLREDSYSEARIKAFMHKGYSVNYIKQKLNQEKVTVTEDYIHNVFEEHRESETEQVKRLLVKKLRSIPDDKEEAYKERQKAVRYALSKGHNPGLVFKILKTNFNGSDLIESDLIEFQ
ncbi:MAG: recombination regulator RecX [Bdellovibrionales bacterium]|nr:recombination regulator RecX [Bdellovibrionales bacterium]